MLDHSRCTFRIIMGTTSKLEDVGSWFEKLLITSFIVSVKFYVTLRVDPHVYLLQSVSKCNWTEWSVSLSTKEIETKTHRSWRN